MSNIDQLIDSTVGHELLSFLDAYSGYKQIRHHPHLWLRTYGILIACVVLTQSRHVRICGPNMHLRFHFYG